MIDPVQEDEARRFERLFLPHLGAAYNLARRLTGSDAGARDAVQESCLRAFKALSSFKEEAPRAWLLTIVRNQCYTALGKIAAERALTDNTDYAEAESAAPAAQNDNPETLLMRLEDNRRLERALGRLPVQFREALVLKELEEMSYNEIAAMTRVPVGTVMSRLSRARRLLKAILAEGL